MVFVKECVVMVSGLLIFGTKKTCVFVVYVVA